MKFLRFTANLGLLLSLAFSANRAEANKVDPQSIEAGIICTAQPQELTSRGFFPKNFTSFYLKTKHALPTRLLRGDEFLYLPGARDLSESALKAATNHHSYQAHLSYLAILKNHDLAGYSNSPDTFVKQSLAQGALVTNAPAYQGLTCFYIFTSKYDLEIEKLGEQSFSRSLIARVLNEDVITFKEKLDSWADQINDDFHTRDASDLNLHYDVLPSSLATPTTSN